MKRKKTAKLPKGFTRCNLPFGPIYGRWDGPFSTPVPKDSFSGRNLNQPGILIFTDTGETFLCGDFTNRCGEMIADFGPTTRVVGYKSIFAKDESTMKISQKTKEALYRAIHEAIVDVRIRLALSDKDDGILAHTIYSIWEEQKRILGIKPKET